MLGLALGYFTRGLDGNAAGIVHFSRKNIQVYIFFNMRNNTDIQR